MGHEAAVNLPAETINPVFREEEGKFLLDLCNLSVAAENIVSGEKTPYFLLDEGHFSADHIVDMELLAPAENFTLHHIPIITAFVLYRELITPGKDLFLYVEFHILTSYWIPNPSEPLSMAKRSISSWDGYCSSSNPSAF